MPLQELKCELFSLTEIEVKWEQEENDSLAIVVTDDGITIDDKLENLDNVMLSIEVIEEGRMSDVTVKQCWKTYSLR